MHVPNLSATLVTGSAGHLGEAVMRTLQRAGGVAVGVDLRASPFTTFVGSVHDRDFVRQAMRGVRTVIHTASLHKPHVATHSASDFVETNVAGTLVLLEEAVAAGVTSFVYTSTTSAFGAALTPAPETAAGWITEDVVPVPKNIYGVTKIAAENLCELFCRRHGLSTIVLRTSRFFPEPDDDPLKRAMFPLENVQVMELLYRRVDIEDVVSAHLRAAAVGPRLGFQCLIISATTPFTPGDLPALPIRAPEVVQRIYPVAAEIFVRRGWRFFDSIDRVYVNERARRLLDWQPRFDFGYALERLSAGRDHRSRMAREIGVKGYHRDHFRDGIYPVV